jgi:exosortase
VNTTAPSTESRPIGQSHRIFGVFCLVSSIVLWKTLAVLCVYSLDHESCSHIVLIPLVSAYLLFMERKRIFSSVRPALASGAVPILFGTALYWLAEGNAITWRGNESLSVATLAIVLIWVGGFVCTYGLAAARAAAFPLLFMLLMIPLPDSVLAWTIHSLQLGSTEVTYLIFKIFDMPVLRQGFVLSLPSVSIQVAAECSGIRSSVALFITCLLAAHFYLRTRWKILVFLFLVIPLTVIKNGIRIATLTLLSVYVNPDFLHGTLHRDGGFVFFLLALLLLLPVFLALERSERSPAKPRDWQSERRGASVLGTESMQR